MNDPAASLDCEYRQHTFPMVAQYTYVQSAGVFALESYDRLASNLDLGLVLRPEPRHDLDAIRHDRDEG